MSCFTFCGLFVAIFAVFIGALYSGLLIETGIFDYMDDYVDSNGNTRLKGIIPATHRFKDWGFTEADIPDLTSHTYIVTGANVGLGYWTTYHLASNNAKVIMACRSESKCTKARNELVALTGNQEIITKLMDLSSLKSVQAFAKQISSEYTVLDGLILNAGVMACPFGLTEDGIETQIGTNHFGHFLLTKMLVPLLAKSNKVPTITVVSSSAHFRTYPEGIRMSLEQWNNESIYNSVLAYGQSKLANIFFAQKLAEKLESRGILVNVIHPGAVETDLARHFLSRLEQMVGSQVSHFVQEYILPRGGRGFWLPRDASLTQVFAAVSPKVRENHITGKYFHPIARETMPDRIHATKREMRDQLWHLTEEIIASKLK